MSGRRLAVQFPTENLPLYLTENLSGCQLPLVLWHYPVGILSQKSKKKKTLINLVTLACTCRGGKYGCVKDDIKDRRSNLYECYSIIIVQPRIHLYLIYIWVKTPWSNISWIPGHITTTHSYKGRFTQLKAHFLPRLFSTLKTQLVPIHKNTGTNLVTHTLAWVPEYSDMMEFGVWLGWIGFGPGVNIPNKYKMSKAI